MITQDIVHKKILSCYFYFMCSKCNTQSWWLWHDIKFQLVIEVSQQYLAIFFGNIVAFAECFAVSPPEYKITVMRIQKMINKLRGLLKKFSLLVPV